MVDDEVPGIELVHRRLRESHRAGAAASRAPPLDQSSACSPQSSEKTLSSVTSRILLHAASRHRTKPPGSAAPGSRPRAAQPLAPRSSAAEAIRRGVLDRRHARRGHEPCRGVEDVADDERVPDDEDVPSGRSSTRAQAAREARRGVGRLSPPPGACAVGGCAAAQARYVVERPAVEATRSGSRSALARRPSGRRGPRGRCASVSLRARELRRDAERRSRRRRAARASLRACSTPSGVRPSPGNDATRRCPSRFEPAKRVPGEDERPSTAQKRSER